MVTPTASVAVIGGSGFYEFLEDAADVNVETPYGDPSSPVAIGTVAGQQVAFLPRHGRGHAYPPHLINYRANLWALRSVGVRQVLAPCAVGGLLPSVAPGDIVVPDQLVDRTAAARRATSSAGRCTCRSPTRTATGSGPPSRRPTQRSRGAGRWW